MYQLAWILYDGQYDEVEQCFSSLKELKQYATKIGGEYAWRKIDEKNPAPDPRFDEVREALRKG